MAGHQGTSTRRSPVEGLFAATEAERREINTTLDGTIVSYDRATQRATIQPKLERKFGDKTLKAPPLQEIKVVQQNGGGFGVHVDLKAGDPVTVHFRQRSVDKSQTDGSDTNGAPGRMHDLSDAIAYPGGGEDSKVMTNMPAGGAHFGASDGKKGMQTRADGSTAIVGGPSGSDKFKVGPTGKIDMVSESGDSLLDIVKAALVLIRDHLNSGAPVDSATQVAANQLIAKIDGMKA
ncbi:Gp138 family membrane-puncturing spike protein [Bosea sp. UC22_33]|uniref:Gp138 family membrane-puncturing spike protein n=1 Tax=Bosea sp. UC22_33 TaxID=3350165 RepID=UPI0036714ABC